MPAHHNGPLSSNVRPHQYSPSSTSNQPRKSSARQCQRQTPNASAGQTKHTFGLWRAYMVSAQPLAMRRLRGQILATLCHPATAQCSRSIPAAPPSGRHRAVPFVRGRASPRRGSCCQPWPQCLPAQTACTPRRQRLSARQAGASAFPVKPDRPAPSARRVQTQCSQTHRPGWVSGCLVSQPGLRQSWFPFVYPPAWPNHSLKRNTKSGPSYSTSF